MTTDYTYYGILFNAGPTTVTLNLPTAPPRGTKIIIKDHDGNLGGAGKFLVTPTGSDKIDMSTSAVTMNIPFMSLTLMYHDSSTSWFII
jgi:hypothetical protein